METKERNKRQNYRKRYSANTRLREVCMYSKEDRNKMERLFNEGNDLSAIAIDIGCTYATVRNVLMARGYKTAIVMKKYSDEEIENIKNDWNNGMTAFEISKKYGRTKMAIQQLASNKRYKGFKMKGYAYDERTGKSTKQNVSVM